MKVVSPSLPSLLDVYLTGLKRNLCVAQPGTVLSYNAAARTCSVQPGAHKLVAGDFDEDVDLVEEYPVLQEVPVCWLVGRGIQVKASLLPGDSVLLICLDRDASPWRRTGAPSAPEDGRLHDWSSAVAIPGLVPDVSPFPEPSDAAALASRVLSELQALRTALNTFITLYNGHTHAVSGAVASAPTTPGVAAVAPTSVASAILKLGS